MRRPPPAAAVSPDGAATAAATTTALQSGHPTSTAKPYSAFLGDGKVEQLDGGVVRMVARTVAGTPVTIVLSALQRRELPGLAG